LWLYLLLCLCFRVIMKELFIKVEIRIESIILSSKPSLPAQWLISTLAVFYSWTIVYTLIHVHENMNYHSLVKQLLRKYGITYSFFH
jgi:hypothetical protein